MLIETSSSILIAGFNLSCVITVVLSSSCFDDGKFELLGEGIMVYCVSVSIDANEKQTNDTDNIKTTMQDFILQGHIYIIFLKMH